MVQQSCYNFGVQLHEASRESDNLVLRHILWGLKKGIMKLVISYKLHFPPYVWMCMFIVYELQIVVWLCMMYVACFFSCLTWSCAFM